MNALSGRSGCMSMASVAGSTSTRASAQLGHAHKQSARSQRRAIECRCQKKANAATCHSQDQRNKAIALGAAAALILACAPVSRADEPSDAIDAILQQEDATASPPRPLGPIPTAAKGTVPEAPPLFGDIDIWKLISPDTRTCPTVLCPNWSAVVQNQHERAASLVQPPAPLAACCHRQS